MLSAAYESVSQDIRGLDQEKKKEKNIIYIYIYMKYKFLRILMNF